MLKCFQIETCVARVKLFCQQRSVLVATFVKLLLKNIGNTFLKVCQMETRTRFRYLKIETGLFI